MNARCKFQVTAVTHLQGAIEVHLDARYDQRLSEEDRAFAKNTPTGSFKAMISNPALQDQFKPGDHYYVDLVKVDGA